MKKNLVFLFSILVINSSMAQHLVSVSLLATKTSVQVSSLLGAGGPYYGARIYKVRYNTTDAFHNPTIASGALMIPVSAVCDTFSLLSYGHGTVLKKTEVPSAQFSNYDGLFFASKGYIVSMPDYLGLGDNAGYHPFLHAETEATATLDLMRAVRECLHDSTFYRLNGKVFITGYSQGGHSAMATLKYIQDHNLNTEFNVSAGATLSGPYSLSRAQLKVYTDSVYSYNAFTPYVINSYQTVYGNLYSNINNYYDSPYNTSIPPYFNGNSSFNSLNAILPVNAYGFMQDSVFTSLFADTIQFKHPLKRDLMLNDNYSWKPLMPLRICYCGSDPLVLPGNSIMARDSMQAKGAPNVSLVNVLQTGDHFSCFTPALTNARNWFDSFRKDCNKPVGITQETQITNQIELFPNPASTFITIRTSLVIQQIEITDITGKITLMQELPLNTEPRINLETMVNGIYTIKYTDQQGNMYFNKFTVFK